MNLKEQVQSTAQVGDAVAVPCVAVPCVTALRDCPTLPATGHVSLTPFPIPAPTLTHTNPHPHTHAQREREERRAEEIHKTLVLHELETLRETNGELEADVAALRAQLAEATARLDEASASVTELNSSTEQFRSDQARMGAINEELKEALTAVTGVSDKQTARIAELEALLHSAHAELDALNASVVVVGDDVADGAAADGE